MDTKIPFFYYFRTREEYDTLIYMKEIILIENVKKSYRVGGGTVNALDGVSLRVLEHEYVAIMGPSGSGKSTLMNVLGCLDTPSTGRYILSGEEVEKMSDRELARVRGERIGFVFQSFNLLPRYDAVDNVALPLIYRGIGREVRRRKACRALEAVGLSERLGHKPGEMSGGQRQRVAIARALVGKPDLILADEPTGNLDSATSLEIMALFEEIYSQGNTIIIVTHEEDIARCARRIIRLRDGRIESDTINNEPAMARKEI